VSLQRRRKDDMKNTTDIDLRTRCREHGIYIAAHNPTLTEILQAVETRLAADKQAPPQHQCDREEWLAAIESLERFQTTLRAQTILETEPIKNPGQNRPTIPSQPHTDRPETGQDRPTTGQTLPNTGQSRPTPGHETAKPSTTPQDSVPFIPSMPYIKSIPTPPNANNSPEPNSSHSFPSPHSSSESKASASSADEREDLSDDDDEEELTDEEEEDEQDEQDSEEWEDHHAEADLLNDAEQDLQAALTGRNRFAQLSDKEQAAVVALLETHDSHHLVKILREPPPIGLNFKISKSALNDFARRYRKQEHERREKNKLENAEQILDTENSDRAFHQIAERILKLRLLTSPDADLKSIDAIVTILAKLRKQTAESAQKNSNP
jgi:hypothetical protein